MFDGWLKKYVCVRQYDVTDCGAACLASVARYYGLKISLTIIREMSGTDTQGANAYGLIHAAKQLGFSVKGFKASNEDLHTSFKLPAIANVIVDNKLTHFVAIYSIKNGVIIAADPDKGIVKYSIEFFNSIWTGGLILLEPGESFQKGNLTQNMLLKFTGFLKPLIGEIISRFLDASKIRQAISGATLTTAHDFIDELPQKYDTFLHENGTNLSEGQKQRLAIARAILIKPHILILDEATSNLDSISEGHIKNALDQFGADTTFIIISHRLSTVIDCDHIYVLEKGEVAEAGSHEELISKEECYYKM